MQSKEFVSVSQYLDNLNSLLKNERAKIIGEVSGLKLHQNGHYYFSLLDKSDQSKIDCVIWRSNYKIFGVELADGIEVVVSGISNIYKLNGRLSFIVGSVELAGEGALKIAYEKLKSKLESEGLFSPLKKRPIPAFPHKVGVVTSKSGAVIHDFATNLGKFGFEIIFVDSKVEGQDAVKELLNALKILKTKELDVVVMMRGGGSLESFQAFNNETLVRAVADFPCPIITGIGHEKDAPLVSLVSDSNVSTPTAVANLLNSSWKDALLSVKRSEDQIFFNFSSILLTFQKGEETIYRLNEKIEQSIKNLQQKTSQLGKDLSRDFESFVLRVKNELSQREKIIFSYNPERQLKLGYSIVKKGGKVLRSVKDTKKGDKLDIKVADGIIQTQTI